MAGPAESAVLVSQPKIGRIPTELRNALWWIDNYYDCAHPLPGATGKIAHAPETHGNPIDKALPIMLLKPDGRIEQKAIAWTTGTPFESSCR
ncbi:hypothetical protein SAMN05421805_11412 [Saccharopolyspora antimicrobica]|uniref:Uncharacterized protein n=1 Tax=Saccharopolyspora antimicrobica TaxID=455193 RepID=A0A1I5GZE6_9PSEU|nr:hypothetical protein [Saccharopolyspora antimicrobica]RKT89262.1 hypothetical protein ATL45_7716 [Saccharopolyspora antimicrobica]SFO40961.1 hypothetical protein SAMN05421805_11412 [Saccharopolyspora antimicrobica]